MKDKSTDKAIRAARRDKRQVSAFGTEHERELRARRRKEKKADRRTVTYAVPFLSDIYWES